jgi:hypothetical protein
LLIVAQIPLVDLRPLITTSPARLPVPPFPFPTPGSQFVRCFGHIERRRRGGHEYWADEIFFSSAAGALGLPGLELTRLGRKHRSVIPSCAFRRLLCDGGSVARIELGLSLNRDLSLVNYAHQSLNGADCVSIAKSFLDLPVRLTSFRAQPIFCTVKRLPRYTAELYWYATTATSSAAKFSHSYVRPGEQVVLFEYKMHEIDSLPPMVRRIDPNLIGGASLAFGWYNENGRQIPLWFLQVNGVDTKITRRIRLGLLRLHAERQALREVLTSLANGVITYAPRTQSGDRLEQFLLNAIKILATNDRAGISQVAIHDVIAAEQFVNEEEGELLQQRLKDARRLVKTRLNEYLRLSEAARVVSLTASSGGTINVNGAIMSEKNETNTQNIIGSTITNSAVAIKQRLDNSFNRIEEHSNATLQEALKELHSQVTQLIGKVGDDHKETLARDLDGFVAEATASKPRKPFLEMSADGLIKAAKTVAQMAGPITATVMKIISLFP